MIQTVKNPQHSSISKEHYTPAHIVELARATMGCIDLDPASCPMANEVVKANHFFSQAMDGLSQDWWGNVFVNPPGGKIRNRSSQAVWWDKLQQEYLAGRIVQAVFVGFSLEILAQRQSILDYPFCIPSGRIRFLTQLDGLLVENPNPTHANVLVHLPQRPNVTTSRFLSLFSQLGQCGVLSALARSPDH
jgi:ParB family chromosome partitioning protein